MYSHTILCSTRYGSTVYIRIAVVVLIQSVFTFTVSSQFDLQYIDMNHEITAYMYVQIIRFVHYLLHLVEDM